jgi:8-amino-7-oxononanoate synthase
VVQAAADAVVALGAGSTGARLTTGTRAAHQLLEQELALLKGAERALFFGSGYLAAVGTIPALVGRGDLILSDALNHACLIDGCRLSRAEVRVYQHGDVSHAAELLRDRASYRRALVVTDGVFSMDGDLAPLPDLVELCSAADAWLMVDDAHGTGVLGETGAGTVEHFGLEGRVPVQLGTTSKALGAEGGFIAGPAELIDYLCSRARSFIFSTAPTPATVAAVRAALRVLRAEPQRRRVLAANGARLREGLAAAGLQVADGITPIVPVVIGDAVAALRASQELEEAGVFVAAIRPPTVPEGTARLRVCVSAAHTGEMIDRAAAEIARVVRGLQ